MVPFQTYMQQAQPVQQYVQTVQQQVYYTTSTAQGTQVVVQQPVRNNSKAHLLSFWDQNKQGS